MPRPDKVAVVDDVRDGLTQSAATLLTHYRGLSVTDVAELREKLRENNARMRVAKNTLSRRAAQDAGIDGLADMLSGPTGLVFCEDDPVGPAKALRDFAKDHPELVIRGGYFDGEILDEVAATKLADLESREDLLAKLAGLMYGALANTARLLNAATEKQARLMQALVDAGGVETKGFSPEPAAPAADEPTAADPAPADDDAPAEPAAETPADEAPAEPAAETPADEAPAEPAAETPADDAPAEPAAETPADDAPAEPAAEAPAEDAPEAAAEDDAESATDEA